MDTTVGKGPEVCYLTHFKRFIPSPSLSSSHVKILILRTSCTQIKGPDKALLNERSEKIFGTGCIVSSLLV